MKRHLLVILSGLWLVCRMCISQIPDRYQMILIIEILVSVILATCNIGTTLVVKYLGRNNVLLSSSNRCTQSFRNRFLCCWEMCQNLLPQQIISQNLLPQQSLPEFFLPQQTLPEPMLQKKVIRIFFSPSYMLGMRWKDLSLECCNQFKGKRGASVSNGTPNF